MLTQESAKFLDFFRNNVCKTCNFLGDSQHFGTIFLYHFNYLQSRNLQNSFDNKKAVQKNIYIQAKFIYRLEIQGTSRPSF